MNKTLLTIICLLLVVQTAHSLERRGTIQQDLTGDGDLDQVGFLVTGPDNNHDITWKITVHSSGRTLFNFEKSIGTKSCFDDPECVGNCTDYNSCRDEWFDGLKLSTKVFTVGRTESRHSFMLEVFKQVAPRYYISKLNFTEQEAEASVNRLAEHLADKDISGVILPDSILTSAPLMVYDKFNDVFVSFYAP